MGKTKRRSSSSSSSSSQSSSSSSTDDGRRHRRRVKRLRKELKFKNKFLEKQPKKKKERFDKTRIQAKKYLVDDVVMVLKTDAPCTGASRKLVPKYKGPFKVTKVLYNDRYEVVDLRENYKRYKTVVAADKMKPWILLRGRYKMLYCLKRVQILKFFGLL
ncbi:unnamed protein product [Acanthoscelides obtectus]|uniref:Uncharacterized protein n=1 Tax=Acanthoscelides obtectus TaxID=200917 RepID=A0A9P0LMX2_ACAOB|nr:unnamed protein product [Acanthoscelides obtectus]CAK1623185.1 hypothetical protein AOBTE_LOCUS1868 [Acanthoscelides obtectus]